MLGNDKIPFEYQRIRLKVGQKSTVTGHPNQVIPYTPGINHPNPFDFIPVLVPTFPNPAWTVSDALIISLSNAVNQSVDVTGLAIGSAFLVCTINGVESRTLVDVFQADTPDFITTTSTLPG